MNSFSFNIINNINNRLKKLELGGCYEEWSQVNEGVIFFEARIYWNNYVKPLDVNTIAGWFIELGVVPESLRISNIDNSMMIIRFQQVDNEEYRVIENDIGLYELSSYLSDLDIKRILEIRESKNKNNY